MLLSCDPNPREILSRSQPTPSQETLTTGNVWLELMLTYALNSGLPAGI